MIKRFTHWLAHLTKQNRGCIVYWRRADGMCMVGFKCLGCDNMIGIHPIPEPKFGLTRK